MPDTRHEPAAGDGRAFPAPRPAVFSTYDHIAPLIIHSTTEAVVATDFDGKIIYWNPAAERLYGWTAAEVLGQNVFEVMGHIASIDRTRQTLEAMRSRESWIREITLTRRDGSTFSGEISISQLRDDTGDVIGVVAITSDITERRHAEQRLSILYAVSRLLAEADDLASVAGRVLEAICNEIQWDWCALWLVDRQRQVLRCIATHESDSGDFSSFSKSAFDIEFSRGTGLVGDVWDRAEPEWIVDIAQDSRMLRQSQAVAAGIRTAMEIPIQLGSRDVQGVLELTTRARLEPNEPLLAMVSTAARQLGLFIERQRARESLVENEFRLRRLEESDLIGIIRATLDGLITGANDAFLSMVGYTRDDLDAGIRWDAMTPDDWKETDQQIIQELLDTGRSSQREKEYLRKDGTRIAVLIGAARLVPDDEDVVAFVVNISARKEAEQERERSLEREQTARVAALEAQRRAEQLLDVTAAFSRARTPKEIARVTMNEGMTALGASGCSFTLVNDAGDALELIDSVGYGPGTLDRWRTTPLSLSSGFPVTECVVRAEPIWVPSREDLFERFPVTRTVNFTYSASIAALPLFANGRPVGAINIGFQEERSFTEPERVYIETLVQFCSQALERAWIYEREQQARQSADAAQKRAEQLMSITAALSRALVSDEVAKVVIDQGLAALGVKGGAIALLDDDGQHLSVIHARGYPQASIDAWQREPIPLTRKVPMTAAVQRGEPVWIYSRQELSERFPDLAGRDDITSEALVTIPLIAGNQTYGVMGLLYQSADQLDQSERIYVRTLARLLSQALERAHLFERERQARLDAEIAQQRFALLAEAGELLTSSLDTNVTLSLVARMLVPAIADWCAVDVLDRAGLPDRVSIIHSDPEKIRWAEDLQRRFPYDPDSTSGLASVLRSGKSELIPVVTDEMIEAAALDDEHLEIIQMVGFSSVMIVPMIARGRTVGAITLVQAESGRHYDTDDLTLAEDLAYRAALAIDNARLFEESQRHGDSMNAIAQATRSFAEAGPDIPAIMDHLARHVAEHVGDWSVVRLPSDDGVWLNPAAIHHPDPEARDILQQMFMQDPLRANEGLTGKVATSGEALIIPHIDPDALRQRIKPEYRKWMDHYAMYAVLIVPMRRHNQTVGTVALFRGRQDVPYTDDDRQFVQNVADRAALALENAQLFQQVQEAVRLREEFLSIASHELRTPLTTITGFAHLLNQQVARGTVDPARVEMITGSLLTEANRLNQLVGDLLDVTRIQQGRLDIRPEPCDLVQILQDVVARLQETYEHSVGREIDIESPERVDGVWDATRIDQVVTNLLTNALKYSGDGKITLRLQIEQGDTARLDVRDEGAGIPMEQQGKLFEPFIRGADAHHKASGTGLGLYITRQIIEHHGGSIELHSALGEGTTFTVRLPVDSTE